VRQGDAFVSYTEVGLPVPLPNPATIDIQGTLVYFQVFYISSTPTTHFAAAHDDADFSTITGAPKKKGHKSSSAGTASLLPLLLLSLFASDTCGVVVHVPCGDVCRCCCRVSAANKRKRGQGVTYSEMIQTALRALGGAATQPKISRYIQEHYSASTRLFDDLA
jgi:hypothetical protein